MLQAGNDPAMTTEAAARELREELGEIAAVEGCAGCECLLGVAAQALADLRRLPGDEARDAEADVRRLLAAGKQAPHGCLECDPCLPVEPYRRFRAALAAAGAVASGGAAPAAAPGDTGDGRADAPSRGCPGCGCDGCG
jgi:8-oxo-dGTP pyrophosphatase MutT (NUDIX family)